MYASTLKDMINSKTWDGDVNDKACQMEHIFVEAAAASCARADAADDVNFQEVHEEIRYSIQRQKSLENGSVSDRSALSK